MKYIVISSLDIDSLEECTYISDHDDELIEKYELDEEDKRTYLLDGVNFNYFFEDASITDESAREDAIIIVRGKLEDYHFPDTVRCSDCEEEEWKELVDNVLSKEHYIIVGRTDMIVS